MDRSHRGPGPRTLRNGQSGRSGPAGRRSVRNRELPGPHPPTPDGCPVVSTNRPIAGPYRQPATTTRPSGRGATDERPAMMDAYFGGILLFVEDVAASVRSYADMF